MADAPLHELSLAELGRRLRSGALTPVALTEHLLARIAKLDPKLHAFCLVTRERALAQAQAAGTLLKAGVDLGPLHGLPYVAKDLFDVKGFPTTAGTRVRAKAIAAADSTVTRKLDRAGMVLLGKTHTVQFAYGGVGINSDMGTPHNPWHREAHAPGGSSSGTAVAVASGLSPFGLGTDTGGSVRLPASLCGIVGLKTTVGRISRAGVYPLSYSLDSVGPLARTVEDAALVYEHLNGEDAGDDTTTGIAPHEVLSHLRVGVKGLRLAFPETTFFDELDPEVGKAVREAGRVLKDLGATVESIALPEAAEAAKLNPRGLMIAAEAYAYNRTYMEEHFDALDPFVRDRMRFGKDFSGPDYFERTRRWAALREQVVRTLEGVDALLVPATPMPALPLKPMLDSMEVYFRDNARYLRNTAIGNILKFCGVSLPCGFTGGNLPIGLLVYGKPFAEHMALRVAHAYEQATPWHTRRPDLGWAG
jgi:aspartyl-tRNA(Asn)/glutamyl-tRNA(Gln) amidotransferase subunit A